MTDRLDREQIDLSACHVPGIIFHTKDRAVE